MAANLNTCEEQQRFAPGELSWDPVHLVRLGAARNLPGDHFRYSDTPPRGRCKVALSPVIEPDGNVYACCGPSRYSGRPSPLVLGNVNEEPLDGILARSFEDPLLNAIRLIGPYGLLQLLKNDPRFRTSVPLRSRYTGICELCIDLTDSVSVVAALRSRIADTDAQALLTAASLWVQHNESRTTTQTSPNLSFGFHQIKENCDDRQHQLSAR